MVKLNKRRLSLLAICLLVILFYGFVAKLYFAQDDFFHLRVSQTDGSIKEFLNLFSFRSFSDRGGIYFYRPIFREGLFNIFSKIFGLSPFPFRVFQLMIHLANTILVYKLILELFKKEKVALIASLVFGISSANIGILSYLAGGVQASGMTMFLLLSMIYFLKERRNLAFLFFVLGLSSHELAAAYPAILAGLIVLRHKLSNKFLVQLARQVLPYVLVVAVSLYFQAKVIGLPTSEAQYGFNFSFPRIINSYTWYFIWSLGVPEMLLDFVGPGLRLNPNLMIFWGNYFMIIFPLFLTMAVTTFITIIKIIKNKLFWFFALWFVVGTSPVVFLPLHRSTYYLAFSLIGIAGMVALAFDYLFKTRKFLSYLMIGSFIILSVTTVLLSQKTFWAITRAKIARELISDIKDTYPSLPKGATIYFLNDPNYPVINKDWGGSAKQAKVALSGSDALGLLYDDDSLKVLYENDGSIPMGKYIFPIIAKIRI